MDVVELWLTGVGVATPARAASGSTPEGIMPEVDVAGAAAEAREEEAAAGIGGSAKDTWAGATNSAFGAGGAGCEVGPEGAGCGAENSVGLKLDLESPKGGAKEAVPAPEDPGTHSANLGGKSKGRKSYGAQGGTLAVVGSWEW